MNTRSEHWVEVALSLAKGLSDSDRFGHLLTSIRQQLNCDASALLVYQEQQFAPVAIDGLFPEVLGRRFAIEQHPRFEAIARAGDVVRFPSDSELPDPYDGLIPSHQGELHVHSCIGLPLIVNQRLIGAVTIDAFNPDQFAALSNQDLRIISSLAAVSLNTALLMEQLEHQAGLLQRQSDQPLATSREIIGQSQQMLDLKSQIQAVANTDMTVLVMGETGVGKELVAHALHEQSARHDQNLIYLNCAALPESVAESELFGHIKGAFTGAISNRKGKFELADGGSLFLDEVGELSPALQAKLLRALQYGDVQPVGSEKNIKVDVRIIAATNRPLHEEVKAGNFRADLYHRLSVFPIHVPALKERSGDIELLSGFFCEQSRHKLNLAGLSIDPAAMQQILQYPWPGNVRELEHAIARASVLARAESTESYIVLQPAHFKMLQQEPSGKPQSIIALADPSLENGLRDATDQFQKQLIEKAFSASGKNWAATARVLKIDPGNLHRTAKRLGIKK